MWVVFRAGALEFIAICFYWWGCSLDNDNDNNDNNNLRISVHHLPTTHNRSYRVILNPVIGYNPGPILTFF